MITGCIQSQKKLIGVLTTASGSGKTNNSDHEVIIVDLYQLNENDITPPLTNAAANMTATNISTTKVNAVADMAVTELQTETFNYEEETET